jgi:shikimate kinase
MNVLLIGFSTTGKSSMLKGLKTEINSDIELLDSDYEISRLYNHHIYGLFLDNHKKDDPENRQEIMDEISSSEDFFLKHLMQLSKTYIAALGPNIHTRTSWENYYTKENHFIIFLKANVESVYKGLIRREDDLFNAHGNSPAFGNWNQGVIRIYNPETERYERLSEKSQRKILQN